MKHLLTILLLYSCCCVGQTDSALNAACDQITYEYDKFEESHIWTTSSDYDVMLQKYITGKDTVYYLSLTSYGSDASYGKGVTILFSDKTKMAFPEAKISPKVTSIGGYSFVYHAFIRISKKQLKTLSVKRITDYRLYIYDSTFEPVEGDKIMRYAKCLLKRKL